MQTYKNTWMVDRLPEHFTCMNAVCEWSVLISFFMNALIF